MNNIYDRVKAFENAHQCSLDFQTYLLRWVTGGTQPTPTALQDMDRWADAQLPGWREMVDVDLRTEILMRTGVVLCVITIPACVIPAREVVT